MASPDIILGPLDTAPLLEETLRGPQQDDGSDGDPLDLTGCTVVLKYQRRARDQPPVELPVTVLNQATNRGGILLDWLAVSPELRPSGDPGTNFDARFVVTEADGHQISVPNAGFLLMQISEDFVPVP